MLLYYKINVKFDINFCIKVRKLEKRLQYFDSEAE